MKLFSGRLEADVERPRSAQEIIDRYAVPPGYRRALLTDCHVPMVCEECGATVNDSGAEKHTAWHEAGH